MRQVVFVLCHWTLGLEELIGGGKVGDFLVGHQGDQTFLEDLEAALDLTLGLGIGRDPVVNAQGSESTLELRMGIQPVSRGSMAKQ